MNKIVLFILIIITVLIIDYRMVYRERFIDKDYLNSYLIGLYNKFKYKFNDYYKNVNNIVDCTYCIVMPIRKDYMIKEINKIKFNCRFFDAITPKDLTDQDIRVLSSTFEFSFLNIAFYNKKTKLALQLSHTMCYIDSILNKYDTVIIFEDDIISNDLSELPAAIEQFKQSKFEMFYLGYCYLNSNNTRDIDKYLIPVNKEVYCTHAICYKVKYLPNIINFIYIMYKPIDIMLEYYNNKYKNKICISKYVFFNQNDELGTTLEYINHKKPYMK